MLKKNVEMIIFLLLLSMIWIPHTISDDTVFSTTLYVGGSGPGNYTTIQSAINNASNGDTVFVFNGTYVGHILINKSINLIGEEKNTTFIIGYIAYTLSINSDWVNMSRFTIKNSGRLGEGVRIDSCYNNFSDNIIDTPNDNVRIAGDRNIISGNIFTCDSIILSGDSNIISGNTITNNDHGLYFTNSYGNSIFNNSFFNSGFFISNDNVRNRMVINNTINGKPLIYLYGETDLTLDIDAGQIILINCTDITIRNQEICNTTVGIQSWKSDTCVISGIIIDGNHLGIWIHGSNNTIYNNIITNNKHESIRLYGYNNIISSNTILNNSNGIYLYDSDQNNIVNNTIKNNYNIGILLDYDCDFNNIINNTIINNNEGINIHSSNNNIIYNNLFNNIINFYNDGNNIWNISKTLGQNVIGGPYLGGNFWSDYNGIDTNNDGIGDIDTPYGPGDYLPLTSFIDINQSIYDRGFPIRHALDGDWAAAQNFSASVNTLTRVEIRLRKFGTPEFNFTVELRENHPQGTLHDTVIFIPSEVPYRWEWFSVDFTDIVVTPTGDYFIVIPPAPIGVTTSFGYEWGYAFGDQYWPGSFWFTRDGGGLWRDLPDSYEFTYKTYGYD